MLADDVEMETLTAAVAVAVNAAMQGLAGRAALGFAGEHGAAHS